MFMEDVAKLHTTAGLCSGRPQVLHQIFDDICDITRGKAAGLLSSSVPYIRQKWDNDALRKVQHLVSSVPRCLWMVVESRGDVGNMAMLQAFWDVAATKFTMSSFVFYVAL